MTEEEKEQYKNHFNVRKCAPNSCINCSTCAWFERIGLDSGCFNPTQGDFDSEDYGRREEPWYFPKGYGAHGDGIKVEEDMVCDLYSSSRISSSTTLVLSRDRIEVDCT